MLDRVSASASNLINYSLGGGGGWRGDGGGAGGSAILPCAPDSAAAGRKVVSLLADLLPALAVPSIHSAKLRGGELSIDHLVQYVRRIRREKI